MTTRREFAVDLWFNGRDHREEFGIWKRYAHVIMDRVGTVPSVTTPLDPEDAFKVSETRIRMVTTADGLGLGLREKEIRDSGEIPYGMIIRPYTLQEGEAEVVVRLRELLTAHA